jgi:HK97 family phage prohead protease
VRASAFTDGQNVPLTWAHDWTKPIGRGVVKVEGKQAVFDGGFFLNTSAGRDAYETVKAMGELQEFSWGFRVLGSEKASHDGQTARAITKAEVFEVSPVLVGANRNTRTLAIKGQERFEDQDRRLLADLDEYIVRHRSLADLRAKEGRAISGARRQALSDMADAMGMSIGQMQELHERIMALLSETAPPEKRSEVERIMADFLAIQAAQARAAVGVGR